MSLPKRTFNYLHYKYENEELTPDCSLSFNVNDDGLSIDVDWIDPATIGCLVGMLKSGDILTLVLDKIQLQATPEDLNIIDNEINNIVQISQNNQDRPVIEPVHAIRHLMTMNQPSVEGN